MCRSLVTKVQGQTLTGLMDDIYGAVHEATCAAHALLPFNISSMDRFKKDTFLVWTLRLSPPLAYTAPGQEL